MDIGYSQAKQQEKKATCMQWMEAYVKVDNIMIIIYTFSSPLPCSFLLCLPPSVYMRVHKKITKGWSS